MNIILSPDFLEFDILLLFLFIICCISIYKSLSLKNRYDQYESFTSGGSCCMERFHVVKLMDSMVTDIEKKFELINNAANTFINIVLKNLSKTCLPIDYKTQAFGFNYDFGFCQRCNFSF